MRLFSLKAVAFSAITLAASVTAQADIVFDNFSNNPNGLTSGTTIAAAFNTGNLPLLFQDVLFPQINTAGGGNVDTFVNGETFAIYTRTGNGLLGSLVSPVFYLQHQGNSALPGFGQTDAIAGTSDANQTPLRLAANSSYYMVLTAPTVTGWQFTTDTTYNTADGVSLPSGNIAYEQGGPQPGYKQTGVQLANIQAAVTTVPDTGSSFGLLALAMGALVAAGRLFRHTAGSVRVD